MDVFERKDLNALPISRERFGDAYALIGVYCGTGSAEEQLRDELARTAGSGFLAEGVGPVNYVLVPSGNDEDVQRQAGELCRRLSLPSWTAATRQWHPEIQAGKQEIHYVTAIAVASGRPSGLYRVMDLPVEYAVVRKPAVLRRLVEIISPIVDQPLLRAAVEPLAATDGNRSKAGVVIGVHHSTFGYRLRRIRELTGVDPTSARGLAVLSTAVIVHAAVHGDILRGMRTSV
jgi:hypothetical protein